MGKIGKKAIESDEEFFSADKEACCTFIGVAGFVQPAKKQPQTWQKHSTQQIFECMSNVYEATKYDGLIFYMVA